MLQLTGLCQRSLAKETHKSVAFIRKWWHHTLLGSHPQCPYISHNTFNFMSWHRCNIYELKKDPWNSYISQPHWSMRHLSENVLDICTPKCPQFSLITSFILLRCLILRRPWHSCIRQHHESDIWPSCYRCNQFIDDVFYIFNIIHDMSSSFFIHLDFLFRPSTTVFSPSWQRHWFLPSW